MKKFAITDYIYYIYTNALYILINKYSSAKIMNRYIQISCYIMY